MNLSKKKKLAAKVLGAGKGRIIFVEAGLSDIKEAITKQDIRDLVKEGVIILKGVKGRRNSSKRGRVKGRKNRKIRKNIISGKREYISITRKLRRWLAEMKNAGKLSRKEVSELRKKIRNREYKNKKQLKEFLGGVNSPPKRRDTK